MSEAGRNFLKGPRDGEVLSALDRGETVKVPINVVLPTATVNMSKIRELGLLLETNLFVSVLPGDDHFFYVVDGNHRWWAAFLRGDQEMLVKSAKDMFPNDSCIRKWMKKWGDQQVL